MTTRARQTTVAPPATAPAHVGPATTPAPAALQRAASAATDRALADGGGAAGSIVGQPPQPTLPIGAQVSYHAELPPSLSPRTTTPRWQVRAEDGTVVSEKSTGVLSHTWSTTGRWVVACFVDGKELTTTVTILSTEQAALSTLDRTAGLDYDVLQGLRQATLSTITYETANRTGEGSPVSASLPNPAVFQRAPDVLVGRYTLERPPTAAPRDLHWYLSVPDPRFMQLVNYEGLARVRLPSGEAAFYVGDGLSAQVMLSEQQRYDLVCVIGQGGRAPHDGGVGVGIAGQYHQVVTTSDVVAQVDAAKKRLAQSDAAMQKMDPRRRTPLRAVLVTDGGITVPLQLYLGPAADGHGSVLVDATSGASRSGYDGADDQAALRSFEQDNSYPAGQIEMLVPVGGNLTQRQMRTRGKSKLAQEAADISIGGALAALALALLAAPAAAVAIAGVLGGAIAAVLDTKNELKQDNPDYTGVGLDVLQVIAAGATVANVAAKDLSLFELAGRPQAYVLLAQLVGGVGQDILVLAEQGEQIRRIGASDMTPEQKRWAVMLVIYSLLKAGYGIATESRKFMRGQAHNFDSKAWTVAYFVDSNTPSPAAVWMRPHDNSVKGSDEGATQGAAPGPQMIVSDGPEEVPCGRAPTMKSQMYRLLGARTEKRRWYALPGRLDIFPLSYFGYNLETIGGADGALELDGKPLAGRKGYNLGGEVESWFAIMTPGEYDIVCIEEDAHGKALPPVARRHQRVTPAK